MIQWVGDDSMMLATQQDAQGGGVRGKDHPLPHLPVVLWGGVGGGVGGVGNMHTQHVQHVAMTTT